MLHTLTHLLELLAFCALFYHRASRLVWMLSLGLLLLVSLRFGGHGYFCIIAYILCFAFLFTLLYVDRVRYLLVSHPILKIYRRLMPSMSRTEREALAAGSVSWEGELFRGAPDWRQLLKLKAPQLTAEEQAFIDGPVTELCSRLHDWEITHERVDLPPDVWQFIREHGFFGLIIPKQYGGKAFSAFAHSQILIKIYGVSTTAATTVSVPNSLGPAELLLHYGTEAQKNYYLPRLAQGLDIPCFALTGPSAGSDAGAIPDRGIVTWGEHEGQRVLGIRLNFNKRYITLAPVATVIGLAFKLYDPDHLIGKKENIGITCALIPRATPGMQIGRRHFPLNQAFQNGPIHGKDVFIPLEWVIGGQERVGQGWKMLMECLAAGRALSLPAGGLGGAKALTFATGAYARIRRQFNIPIGRFEGVEEALARIIGFTYIMDGTRLLALQCIDAGAKPAIASAIVKYHVTEFGRRVVNDAMDVHGGKGICLGPNNYLGRGYQALPIGITVEGANILTRSLIIFGQGAMRCHPYIFDELEAAKISDEKRSLKVFDRALMGHAAYTVSNWVRTLIISLTSGRCVDVPCKKTRRYFQQATRFSSAFALLADMSLLVLGGNLKRKESLSARLGDILSYLYILSGILKTHHDAGLPEEDKNLIAWTTGYCFYELQERCSDYLQNFPVPILRGILRFCIFPYGKRFAKPSDRLSHQIAQAILAPSPTRDRVIQGVFMDPTGEHAFVRLEKALLSTIAAEPLEKMIRAAAREDKIEGNTFKEQADEAFKYGLITEDEHRSVSEADAARNALIAVDDFDPKELARVF